MTEFIVVWERVHDPSQPGLMLGRGYSFLLQPELYPAHARLATRLRRKVGRGWEERKPLPAKKEERPVAAAPLPGTELLPHQAEAIEQMKRSFELEHGE